MHFAEFSLDPHRACSRDGASNIRLRAVNSSQEFPRGTIRQQTPDDGGWEPFGNVNDHVPHDWDGGGWYDVAFSSSGGN